MISAYLYLFTPFNFGMGLPFDLMGLIGLDNVTKKNSEICVFMQQ